MADVALRLAPGTGLLVRRPTALLYSAPPDPALVEAFLAAPEGGELQALASATVAAGFAVGAFVGLSWDGLVRVMAFGDVAVETDQPSLPMLSGAGSRTWVEHSVTVTAGAVVEVSGVDTDAVTDLVAGTVLAGGFRLELRPAAAPAAAATTTPGTTVDDTASVPRMERTVVVERQPAEQPTAVAAAAAPSAGRAAPTAPDAVADGPADTDDTLPPPASEALIEDLRRDVGTDNRSSLVDAKLCADGHANPPTAATCAVCGEFLAPGATALVHVPRPSLGRLQLDDGELVDLDRELLIGRSPDRDDDPARASLRRVKTVGEKVSRSHLEVRFQGWDVLVADCGSTNGTFTVPHPGGQVAALEPGRPQMIDPGAVVYFGSRSFTLLGREKAR
jgi:FHA domain-containing protein